MTYPVSVQGWFPGVHWPDRLPWTMMSAGYWCAFITEARGQKVLLAYQWSQRWDGSVRP